MAVTRLEINIDGNDIERLAAFWSAALGYVAHASSGPYRSLVPALGDDDPAGRPKLILQQVPEPPAGTKNRLHLDLIVGSHFEAEAQRLVGLGATRLTDGVIREAGTAWIVLADPEGNEFCVCGT